MHIILWHNFDSLDLKDKMLNRSFCALNIHISIDFNLLSRIYPKESFKRNKLK